METVSPAMSHFQFWLERWRSKNGVQHRCSQYRCQWHK